MGRGSDISIVPFHVYLYSSLAKKSQYLSNRQEIARCRSIKDVLRSGASSEAHSPKGCEDVVEYSGRLFELIVLRRKVSGYGQV